MRALSSLSCLIITLALVAAGCQTETRNIGAVGDAGLDLDSTDGSSSIEALMDVCERKCPPSGKEAQCPPAEESETVCLSGRVFDAVSLFKNTSAAATPIGPGMGVEVKIYDWVDFRVYPTETAPLAVASIYNEHGCFIVDRVNKPNAGYFGITTDDVSTSPKESYAIAMITAPRSFYCCDWNCYPSPHGLVDIELPAVRMSTARQWGNGLLDEGAMLMWFRWASGRGESGVTPVREELEPDEESGDWEGSTLLYFNDDLSGFDEVAKADRQTTSSGLVAVRPAGVRKYHGKSNKGGCLEISGAFGFSVPQTLQIARFDVAGTDIYSDPESCGACGRHCPAWEVCEAGRCICPPDKAMCQGECVNLDTDSQNCGACGAACMTGAYCKNGDCACLPGKTECPGECVNINLDPDNCGACGAACKESDSFCNGGACIKPQWVTISKGSFTMGSPTSESCREPVSAKEETQHQVTLTHDFEIWSTEVSQGRFQELMGYNPANHTECGKKCPVEMVSWHEAGVYCNKLSATKGLSPCYSCVGTGAAVVCTEVSAYSGANIYKCPGYRLPTEAEWEYAYRAGSSTALYPSAGNDGTLTDCTGSSGSNVNKIGWYEYNANWVTFPAGRKAPNAWGLFDMAGNVWEWCHDWYQDELGSSPVSDPWGADDGSKRVMRGGACDTIATFLRAAVRRSYPPWYHKDEYFGFRPCRTVNP